MISWIVATHNLTTLYSNLVASLHPLDPADEFIVIPDPMSIALAYAEGQTRATKPIRCYVHHDVYVLDPPKLRAALKGCTDYGMTGVVGSRDELVPWWDGDRLGSVFDQRAGLLDFGPGGECSILDGLLLATTQTVEWDESFPGFHGYDHDSCRQMLARGLTNHCLTNGHELVRHNTTGSTDPDQLVGWNEAVDRYRAKWGG